ncbi:hypothetical protein N7493_006964 [Penicillium malachiteum]|uniref:Phosphoglycerate mutase family protein n=1 Tax=Penicillium malachiteum TaxID=1324776 RepID=A0AAD6MV52_9EURO|nr:hypothetical protein N7493_006964 [Penicillium malachiteum]
MHSILLSLLALSGVSTARPDVYFIRHGEKPHNGGIGLSDDGLERAECIRDIFGDHSDYNIGYIMAQKPKKSECRAPEDFHLPFGTWHTCDYFKANRITAHTYCQLWNIPTFETQLTGISLGGKRNRPYETVKPLAEDLSIKVDISCKRDDSECVKDTIDDYDGEGNILICWEHHRMTDLVEELGYEDAPEYPDDRYDLIWTDPYPYTDITEIVSEKCPGLDWTPDDWHYQINLQ